MFDTRPGVVLNYASLSLKFSNAGGVPMSIPFEPSKEFAFKAAKTAGGFARKHVEVSWKATPDGISITVRLRFRGTSPTLAAA